MDEICEIGNSDKIIIYKEDNGFVYGYLNQKELDLCLYNRAKEKSHNFTDKDRCESERSKRPVWLADIGVQRHSILFRPLQDGSFVSKGNVVLDIGLDSIAYGQYFRSNNISEVNTWLCCGIRIYSSYDGYFKNQIKDSIVAGCNLGNEIKDGDLLFSIELAEKSEDVLSEIKSIKFDYSLLPKCFLDEIPYLSEIIVSEWITANYSYVKKGDEILVFSEMSSTTPTTTYTFKSPYSGLLKRNSNLYSNKLRNGISLCKIYPDENLLKKEHQYSFNVTKDNFTKSTIVSCQMSSPLGFHLNSISINFENNGGYYYMLLLYDKKELRLTKQCSFHFLLDNNNVVSLTADTNPVEGVCRFQLSDLDMDNLGAANFKQWRITNSEGLVLKEGENLCCFDTDDPTNTTKKISLDVFQNFIKDFIKKVEDSLSEEELINMKNSRSEVEESCYVYLMIDTTNNFHKIGISNNPKYREHTLQSDKPTIELICAKEYPSRVIAEAIESALHRAYAGKRIRGEWFNLNLSDIEAIKQTLK